jgi:hypothetical protein
LDLWAPAGGRLRYNGDIMPESWLLMQNGNVLGALTAPSRDQPWIFCKFEAAPEFERLRPLFEEEVRLLNSGQTEAFLEAADRMQALKLELTPQHGGKTIRKFMIHVEGDKAWFRY